MHLNEKPSAGKSRDHAARAAEGPAGRRGWTARLTSRGTVLAAAAVIAIGGVTGLVLALTLTWASATTKPSWIMGAGNIEQMSQQDAATASHFFNTSASFCEGASLVSTPVQRGYATTPVLSYTSYAQFSSDIQNHRITYGYKWVLYDPEEWSQTPQNEQVDPVKYMTLFGQLAHANGLKVIMVPGLDLGSVAGSVLPRHVHETISQWYLRTNIAGAAAAAANVYILQDESNLASLATYDSTFSQAKAQAEAANSNVLVFSEVSTANGSVAQMVAAAQSITADGFYVATPGAVAQGVQFFEQMKAAGY
jgi:hypothetical protein